MYEINIKQPKVGIIFLDSYEPTLDVFVWTYSNGSFVEWEEIRHVSLDRKDGSITKQFSGVAEAQLLSGNEIFWIVNGDFFDNGSTSISYTSGASAKIGEVWTVSYSVTSSSTSNHFAYHNENGGIYLHE
ncbi:hypothetical protein [Chengkuizengella axinellae]|uniref:Uncharacterized protein n=1 Tax=Chengkuizengella axinellae TaxID=3064388 RepID=A0ABT9J1C3_9BACL|nr:hypothetical protein [Chengkuizengella sp. 2205SS18-9]MDP5274815.1 hypothetical protein [Chengkuizengella sp. 2205SS18-9]